METDELNKKYLDIFRSRIKQIRFDKNWTLDEASERCFISPNFLSKLENGKRKPTFTTLINLSIGFEVPLSLLVLTDNNTEELELLINLFHKYDKINRKI